MAIAGMKLIVPTSVTAGGSSSASISETGKVTFTNMSSTSQVSINGCFTPEFDNYLIVFYLVSNNVQASYLRLRASGSDTTSNYVYQELGTFSSNIYGNRQSTSRWEMIVTSTTAAAAHAWIYGPNLAQPTSYRQVGMNDGSGNDPNWRDCAGTQSSSTQFDGFTIYADPTDNDGSLCVYGLSQ